MRAVRQRLTYANVVSTIALFVAIGGGAYAAATIGPGDIKTGAVRSRQIKNRAVRKADLAKNSVGAAKVANGSLTGAELKKNSIGGPRIDESSLVGVNAATLGGLSSTDFLSSSKGTQCVTTPAPVATSVTATQSFGLPIPSATGARPTAYSITANLKASGGNTARVYLAVGGVPQQVIGTSSTSFEQRTAVPGFTAGSASQIGGYYAIGGNGLNSTWAVDLRYASSTFGDTATFGKATVCFMRV